MVNNTYKNGIKIMSLEGADILKNNLKGWYIKKDYKAVFADSLLLDKLLDIGLDVSKNNTTRDIITLDYRFGYTPKEEVAELEEEITNAKDKFGDTKKYITKLNQKITIENNKKDNYNKKINELNDLIDKCNNDLVANLAKDIEETKKIISKSQDKIIKNKDKIVKSDEKIQDLIEEIKEKTKDLSTEGEDKQKLLKKLDETDLSADQVREKLYTEGFFLEFTEKDKKTKETKTVTIEYKFFFRSPSKSRTGQVCFINKELLDKGINKWQRMGLELPKEKAKLVEMLAYESLTSSHLIDRIIIDPSSILVVNDLESYVDKMCAKVNYHISDEEVNENDKEDMCFVSKEMTRVKNVLWDGMALGDTSLYTNNCSMYLLRAHFFKAAMFRCKLIEFLQEKFGDKYETATVKDRYNNDIKVSSIRMITTENAMKWERFTDIGASFAYWKQKVNEDHNIFGIAKEEHPSKYGEYQRLSYQHINSLPLGRQDIMNLAKSTVDFVNKLKNDNEFFIKYLDATKSDVNANGMIVSLYRRNKRFKDTDFFRNFKTQTLSEYKETLREGKLLVEGDNLTVCGNPYLLLLHAVGEVKYSKVDDTCILDDSVVDETLTTTNEGISVYTTRFDNLEEGSKIAMFRNPHNSMSNIGLGILQKHELMKKHFEFSNNIIAFNMIKTDIQDRLNGLDEDSDFCLCSNDPYLVKASVKAQDYLTIVNNIAKDNKPYDDTDIDKANIDNTLAKGKFDIGVSSNVAQLALSWLWKNQNNKKLAKELEDVVSVMSVLAQCAIDASKRTFRVNVSEEINRIKKLPCMQEKVEFNTKEYVAKPYFWKFVKELKEDNKEVDKIKLAKIKLVDADGNPYTKEQIKEQKENNIKEFLKAKTQAKTNAKLKKKEKENELNKHCLENKICPMDFIQEAIDMIENLNLNQYDGKKIKITDLIIKDAKAHKQARVDERQKDKIEKTVKELDNLYKEHYDKKKLKKVEDDEAWESEQIIKTEDTIKTIDKIKISEVTMKDLVEGAFSKNKKYTRKLLNSLYRSEKNRERFLNTFIEELE